MKRENKKRTSKSKQSPFLRNLPELNKDDVIKQKEDGNKQMVEESDKAADADCGEMSAPKQDCDAVNDANGPSHKQVSCDLSLDCPSTTGTEKHDNDGSSSKPCDNDVAMASENTAVEKNRTKAVEYNHSNNDDSSIAQNMASKFYSSLNLLASRAFFNVKLEPTDVSIAERYAQSYMTSLDARFPCSNTDPALYDRSCSSSPSCDPQRPPAELSPDTFAEHLRQNDSVSMVVRRNLPGKATSQEVLNNASSRTNGSSLHHFVTRYTLEQPDDPSRLGVDICLESNHQSEPIIEVECGGNKGLLYVSKLCQGSKGQSIYFKEEWLTPNEFQFISGRETAKDWKRSIRHCGKSLKTLMTKGILLVHPPVCECNYCRRQGANDSTDNMARKRSQGSELPETEKSGSPSYASKSTTPLSLVVADASGSTHRLGREGGLSSIISQLHSKNANCNYDSSPNAGGESLDLSVHSTSSIFRKRQALAGDDFQSDEEELRSSQNPKRPHYEEDTADCTPKYDGNIEKAHKGNHAPERDDTHRGKQRTALNRSWFTGQQLSSHPNPHFDNFESSFRQHQEVGYNEYALYDAMKRAVQTVVAHPNGYPLQTTSIASPSQHEGKKQHLVELTSPRSKRSETRNISTTSDEYNHFATSKHYKELSSKRNKSSMHSSTHDVNDNWIGLPTIQQMDIARSSEGSCMDQRSKLTNGVQAAKPNAPSTRFHVPPISYQRNRQRQTYGAGQQRMVNLNNHAIPMMSLTYRKRRVNKEGTKEARSKIQLEANSPVFFTSDDLTEEMTKQDIPKPNDVLRRLSSSAPPPHRYTSLPNRAKSASPQTKNNVQLNPFYNGLHNLATTTPIGSDVLSVDSCTGSPCGEGLSHLLARKLCVAIEEMGTWSVDDVCKFLLEVGCEQYEKVFRENAIDGDGLPLLMERHLVDIMGMKLGHALKLIARVQRRLGNHSALVPPKHHPVLHSDTVCLNPIHSPLNNDEKRNPTTT